MINHKGEKYFHAYGTIAKDAKLGFIIKNHLLEEPFHFSNLRAKVLVRNRSYHRLRDDLLRLLLFLKLLVKGFLFEEQIGPFRRDYFVLCQLFEDEHEVLTIYIAQKF